MCGRHKTGKMCKHNSIENNAEMEKLSVKADTTEVGMKSLLKRKKR